MRWIIQLSPSVWNSAYRPRTRSPCRVMMSSSSRIFSVSYRPRSQTCIDPPPYSPFGMSPSKSRYSSGWSSVWTARLLRFGSGGRPRGTAKDSSTPSRSSRRSQCMLRAWCSWTTNRPPGSPSPASPAGSGVASKSRLDRYRSRRLLTPPWWPAPRARGSPVADPAPQRHPGARSVLHVGDRHVVHEPVHQRQPPPALVGPARRPPLALVLDDHRDLAVVGPGPQDDLASVTAVRMFDDV